MLINIIPMDFHSHDVSPLHHQFPNANFHTQLLPILSEYAGTILTQTPTQKNCLLQTKKLNGQIKQLHLHISLNNDKIILEWHTEINLEKLKRTDQNPYVIINEFGINHSLTTSYLQDSKILKYQQIWPVQILVSFNLREMEGYMKELERKVEYFISLICMLEQEQKKVKEPMKKKQIKLKLQQAKRAIQNEIIGRRRSLMPQKTSGKIVNIEYPNPQIRQIQEQVQCSKIQDLILSQKRLKKKKQKKKDYPNIVRQIQTRKIMEERDLVEETNDSGYSIIKKIFGVFTIDNFSIHEEVNTFLKAQIQLISEQETGIIKEASLIQKSAKKNLKRARQSIETEICILKYLRNYQSNNIASFYLPKDKQEGSSIKIYSDYYNHSLHKLLFDKLKSINFGDVLKILVHLANAIRFMHQLQLSHRDLKPDNIMIDNDKVPKIIDFGSSWVRNNHSAQINKQLKTTERYNLKYNSKDMRTYLDKITQEEFECHEYFDIYFYGYLVQMILEKSNVNFYYSNIFKPHLSWILEHCREPFPYNRISPQQLAYVMSYLYKLYIIFNSPKG